MKELTIEQKAQRYDEGIEKLRDFYRDYDTVSRLIDVKEELANLFPELKESEDERIKKEMLTFFKGFYDNQMVKAVDVEPWIAWLEKQGEQNPTEWKGEDYGIYKSIIDDAVDRDLALTATQKEWIRNLKPQPKQEWSKEDENTVASIISSLSNPQLYPPTIHDIEWLKFLKDRYIWKPSDEQINVCKEVYADILSTEGFDIGTINSELNRLEEELKKLKG